MTPHGRNIRPSLPGLGPHAGTMNCLPASANLHNSLRRLRDLLFRRYPCGHPDPFRSVRDLGRVPARCPRESEEVEGRSSPWLPAWLPAAHDTGHRNALVLVSNIGPSADEGTAPCPAQTPPPNPTAAEPGDGRIRSRPSSRVHEPCTFTDAVALRVQTVLTGSGSHRSSYGGFGGGHPHFRPHNAIGNQICTISLGSRCHWSFVTWRCRDLRRLASSSVSDRG